MNRPAVILLAWLTAGSGHAAESQVDNPPVYSLDQCIAYALDKAPTLIQTRLRLTNQVYNTTVQRAAFDPRVRGETSYADANEVTSYRTTLSETLPAGIDLSAAASQTVDEEEEEDEETTSYTFRLSKTLLGEGSLLETRDAIEDSLVDEKARANTLALEERRLVFQTKRDFYQIVRNLQTLHIQQLRTERSERNLEIAVLKEDPLDIATARLQVLEDEISVIRASQAVSNALEVLKVRIGMPVAEPFAIDEQFAFAPVPVDLDHALEFALEHHESIRNAKLELEKLERDAAIAARKPWPVVRVGAQHQIEEEENADSEDDTRVDLSLEWPLGARADRYRRRSAILSIAIQEEEIYNTLLAREQTIRSLARQLDEARAALDLQEQRVEIGALRLELFNDRWENGEIDILEYIRSQNDLENSKVQLINLKTSYMELLAQFEFDTGLPVAGP